MKKLGSLMIPLLLLALVLPQTANAASLLIPVGQVVGLELSNDTVTVAAIDETLGQSAKAAGLQAGDVLLSVNGHTVTTAAEVRRAVADAQGPVELVVRRDGRERRIQVEPAQTPEGPQLGVYLRQGITGIGTVTWYDPESHQFACLGHGVNDPSGSLLAMTRGSAYPASIQAVKRGQSGQPGQLMGTVTDRMPLGILSANTGSGVFGTAQVEFSGAPMPVGAAEEVHAGKASILSTISGTEVREYSVEILKIYPKSRQNGRNMLLKVTDPALLDATGGIVQGMSGSPILQDGKFIGAVTHVLVNDPTTGYGIFIENMLAAAGSPLPLAASAGR